METPYIESVREDIEYEYRNHPTGCGSSFGKILCYELHSRETPGGRGLTFTQLAEKWGISVTTLGELIYDHCKRMEPLVKVNHDYQPPN